jgi:hypothetical protein
VKEEGKRKGRKRRKRRRRGCVLRIITLEIPFGKYSLVRDKHGETVGAFVRKGSVARDKVPRLTSSHQR